MKTLDSYLNEADIALESGQFTDALVIYKESLEHYPQSDEAMVMLGSVYAELGNIDLALEYINKSISQNKHNATAYVLLAHIYNALNNIPQMRHVLENGVSFCSNDAELKIMLADILMEEGDIGRASSLYTDAYNHTPDDVQLWRKLAYINHCEGDNKSANKFFRKSYDIDKTDLTSICGLIDTCTKLEMYTEALEVSNQALVTYPDHSTVQHFSALALLANKKFNEAHEMIDKAISENVDDLGHHVLKADIYERAGDYERAFEIIKPYLEAKPPALNAILVFARFCTNVDMVQECVSLLNESKNNPVNSDNIHVIDDAIDWLSGKKV